MESAIHQIIISDQKLSSTQYTVNYKITLSKKSCELLRLLDGRGRLRLRVGIVEGAAAAVRVEEGRVDAAQETPEYERVEVGSQLKEDFPSILGRISSNSLPL